MARKTASILITREGRDQGGVFELEEMDAFSATELCLRAMQMVARGGVDVPPYIFQQGVAGFVTLGAGAILAGLGKTPWHEVKPLLDALTPCVKSFTPPTATQPLRGWSVIQSQIQEPTTVLQLYEEVVSLHLGFSLATRLSNLRALVSTMITEFTPDTSTSTGSSASS